MLLAVVCGIVPDYLSLLNSRHILMRMSGSTNSLRLVWLFSIDLALSIPISVLFLCVVAAANNWLPPSFRGGLAADESTRFTSVRSVNFGSVPQVAIELELF